MDFGRSWSFASSLSSLRANWEQIRWCPICWSSRKSDGAIAFWGTLIYLSPEVVYVISIVYQSSLLLCLQFYAEIFIWIFFYHSSITFFSTTKHAKIFLFNLNKFRYLIRCCFIRCGYHLRYVLNDCFLPFLLCVWLFQISHKPEHLYVFNTFYLPTG